MSDRCHVEIVQADGWSEACNQPATGIITALDDYGKVTVCPVCKHHTEDNDD
jgi:hypothetical protein